MIVPSVEYDCFVASMRAICTFLRKDDMQSAMTDELKFIWNLHKERIRQASALKANGMKSDSGADQMRSQGYSSCLTSSIVR